MCFKAKNIAFILLPDLKNESVLIINTKYLCASILLLCTDSIHKLFFLCRFLSVLLALYINMIAVNGVICSCNRFVPSSMGSSSMCLSECWNYESNVCVHLTHRQIWNKCGTYATLGMALSFVSDSSHYFMHEKTGKLYSSNTECIPGFICKTYGRLFPPWNKTIKLVNCDSLFHNFHFISSNSEFMCHNFKLIFQNHVFLLRIPSEHLTNLAF